MALLDWERQLLDDVSRERLMAVTGRLAEWVRHSGTAPELEAAEHLRALLDGWGLRTETALSAARERLAELDAIG